jgi:formylglycine-generating enzyme required for sulfatase activity
MFGDPYDPPEVQSSGTVTASSDLYGLAASLDLALNGERDNTTFAMQTDDPDPLTTVLHEGTASHPNMRFKDASAFRKALLRILRDAPPVEVARSPRQDRRQQADSGRPEPGSMTFDQSTDRPARELPPWAPKAALFGGIGLAVVLALSWLVSLLPDVPDGMVEILEASEPMGDADGTRDEQPGFSWSHDRFFLDRTEVTVGEYDACVRAGGCTPVGTRLARRQVEPAEAVAGVTWLQANAYCAQQGKRLPGENEWEAASVQFGGRYAWGDGAPTCDRAWYGGWAAGPCGRPGVEPVPRGVTPEEVAAAVAPLNLAGNLWEFTNSDYEPHRRLGSGELAAAGSSVLKVLKGGAFSTGPEELRSAARLGVEMDHWAGDVGFRCAKTPDR